MRDGISKVAEKAIAAKADESLGLLVLMKPLLKRAGHLTVAEQNVLLDTLNQAYHLLSDATTRVWEERRKPDTQSMVRAS